MAKYRVHSKVVLWPGNTHSTGSEQGGAWYFAYVDAKNAEAIRKKFGKSKRGFGAIRVTVTLGKSKWQTSIFPDKRSGTYILPLKAKIRHAEDIDAGDSVTLTLEI